MEKTNAITKSTELISVLNTHFKGTLNLARVKFIAHFIIALCKVKTVTFDKLANAFDTSADADSSLRRIQRFIASFCFDSDIVARLIFNLLPKQDKFRLTIDRTNWQFGQTDINIFMLGVVYQGVAFPLLFSMLPKRGNSNTQERIALINRFIRLFGLERIDSLVADREFVGAEWIAYLNHNHIRIRNNFKVFVPHKNTQIIKRIEKLVLLVMIAFVWCYKVGIYLHQLKPIIIKKHGRKAKSIFKKGLDALANFFLNAYCKLYREIIQFL